MRCNGYSVLAGIFFLTLLGAAETHTAIHFPIHGFSIAPLEAPGGGDGMILAMSLPASDGFAPNVNVMSQPASGTMDDYIALSKGGIDKAGFNVIKAQKVDENTGAFEYTGTVAGRILHWYSRAIHKSDGVFLVTATASEVQWPRDAKQLEACVDSFQPDVAK